MWQQLSTALFGFQAVLMQRVLVHAEISSSYNEGSRTSKQTHFGSQSVVCDLLGRVLFSSFFQSTGVKDIKHADQLCNQPNAAIVGNLGMGHVGQNKARYTIDLRVCEGHSTTNKTPKGCTVAPSTYKHPALDDLLLLLVISLRETLG